MADDLDRMLGQYDWRSDANLPGPNDLRGAPPEVRRAPPPRYPTDNVHPMAYDALTAAGLPHHVAQQYAAKLGSAASWTPPGAVADAAASVGGPLHKGDVTNAAGNALLLHALGRLGYGAAKAFLPPVWAGRDANIAKSIDELAPRDTQMWPHLLGDQPGVRTPSRAAENMSIFGFDATKRPDAKAHLQDRFLIQHPEGTANSNNKNEVGNELRRPFEAIEGAKQLEPYNPSSAGNRVGVQPQRSESDFLAKFDDLSSGVVRGLSQSPRMEDRVLAKVIGMREEQRAIMKMYGSLDRAPSHVQERFKSLDEQANQINRHWGLGGD